MGPRLRNYLSKNVLEVQLWAQWMTLKDASIFSSVGSSSAVTSATDNEKFRYALYNGFISVNGKYRSSIFRVKLRAKFVGAPTLKFFIQNFQRLKYAVFFGEYKANIS